MGEPLERWPWAANLFSPLPPEEKEKITLVEQAHPEGPYGVKGIGEPGLAPTAAAIVNAVCHACDADFTSIPIKPEHVLFRKERGHASEV